MAKLTDKQIRFVEEYLVDLNETQAAIRAGYSVKSAGSIGSENMKKPEIRARVEKALAERSKRTGINADRVLQELGKLALFNAGDLIQLRDAGLLPDFQPEDTAAIAGIKIKSYCKQTGEEKETEIRFADKLKALELAGKHLGMFKDAAEGTAPVTVMVNYDYDGG